MKRLSELRALALEGTLGLLVFQFVALPAVAASGPPHRATDEAREVQFLMNTATADSLAAASLLVHLLDDSDDATPKPDSTLLIERAVAMAPNRPELIWLQLRDCELRQCAQEAQIVSRLKKVDPDNGMAFLPALNLSRAGPAAETTRIIALIGAAKSMTLYWNKSVVMLFDALTHGKHSPPATALTHDADDRLSHATGVLTAMDTAPLKPILTVCSSDAFTEERRREACESLMVRLDHADSMIAQTLSTSVQLRWWPTGSAEYDALQKRRAQQAYLVQASARVRGKEVNRDAQRRVDEMRRLGTEEEVAYAMLAAFHEPLQRPVDWRSPGGD